jgi:hypothetical protein
MAIQHGTRINIDDIGRGGGDQTRSPDEFAMIYAALSSTWNVVTRLLTRHSELRRSIVPPSSASKIQQVRLLQRNPLSGTWDTRPRPIREDEPESQDNLT